jgi:hypothetical protein
LSTLVGIYAIIYEEKQIIKIGSGKGILKVTQLCEEYPGKGIPMNSL